MSSSRESPWTPQRIAVDAVVALTDCDRDTVAAFIRMLYLAGVKDLKRLTFKGLLALERSQPKNDRACDHFGSLSSRAFASTRFV